MTSKNATPKKVLYENFVSYHAKHPHVWEAFEEKALIAAQHKTKFGARAIFELLRWETMVSGSGTYKLKDTNIPYYARLFIQKYPEYSYLFKTKEGLYWEDL